MDTSAKATAAGGLADPLMVAAADPGAGTDTSTGPPSAEVRHLLLRRSFAAVEPRLDEVLGNFYGALFTRAPELRALFPIEMTEQRARLGRVLTQLINAVLANALGRPETTEFLEKLGRDHRRFDVLEAHYEVFGEALTTALADAAGPLWTEEVAATWREAYDEMAAVMAEAARAETLPASWTAEVIGHRRIGHDLAVVHVRTSSPLDIQPGQYVTAEIPQRLRVWRRFSPANTPSTDGVLELYVKAIGFGGLSHAIVTSTRVGDVWRIGSPEGNLHQRIGSGRDLLMIGGGTGIAPIHSMVRHLAGTGTHPDNVYVYYGGRSADDLHALSELLGLSYDAGWLDVTAVVDNGATGTGMEIGCLAEVVTRYGAWPDCDVVLSGSPAMLRATVSGLSTAGVAADCIHFDQPDAGHALATGNLRRSGSSAPVARPLAT